VGDVEVGEREWGGHIIGSVVGGRAEGAEEGKAHMGGGLVVARVAVEQMKQGERVTEIVAGACEINRGKNELYFAYTCTRTYTRLTLPLSVYLSRALALSKQKMVVAVFIKVLTLEHTIHVQWEK